MERTFQSLIDGNWHIPCLEMAGCCTHTAADLPAQGLVAVPRAKAGKMPWQPAGLI